MLLSSISGVKRKCNMYLINLYISDLYCLFSVRSGSWASWLLNTKKIKYLLYRI